MAFAAKPESTRHRDMSAYGGRFIPVDEKAFCFGIGSVSTKIDIID